MGSRGFIPKSWLAMRCEAKTAPGKTDSKAAYHQQKGFAQDHARNPDPISAKCHANADLACSAMDGVSHPTRTGRRR
jgi:hypothetical protein